MRRLVALVSAIVLVDTMFYAAITPLLPYYAGRFDLSKSAAGALAAAYPAGTLLLSLPSGWIAARVGVKRTVLAGLALMAVASVAFGFAESAALLGGARFVQGVGGALSWAGALAWLVAAAPADRRSEMIGTAFAFALGGQLLGPILGAAARSAGTELVFSGVAVVGVLLAVCAWRTPVRAGEERERPGGLMAVLRDRRAATGAALVTLVAVFFGVVEVLVPLRLDELGASALVIAGAFLVTAALQGASSPVAGRWVDRGGASLAIRTGLISGCVLAAAVPWPDAVVPIVLLVLLMGPAVGLLWLPGMTLLSEGAERRGANQAYAFAIVNMTWSAAALLGAAGGSALAQATSDSVPYLALSAVFLAALSRASCRCRPARSR
jgi:MFS family permease